ncbi:nitrate reductase molybdenum cofactor assembly chaperone [Paraburkholderia sprentiae WSM5005]|uniref:Nitrate reductase molybdenum cofactor assembly chaperone n=1 Tax=Paraburkholderia sprentiae WSM5005 TaxID=754502 RepID=A0A1I9YQT5_9BURK|nr:nitrate reductase molybdenum cofactor assembly chaperone [Paraburkholderia sprentiae]APA88557.1 nitrate reductase molybdenum cofactor assembly chaperone [Paraburkholderia sprentiae WSM5005]
MKSTGATPPGVAYAVLGALLDYPDEQLLAALPEARLLLDAERALTRESKAGLERFLDYCEARDLMTLQENYVAQFDRGRNTSLYLFEHVHGESRDRGQAMIDLLQMYERHGLFLASGELPDYLPVFLEYLSRLPRDEARALLTETAEILQSIATQLTKRGSAYGFVVGALGTLAGIRGADTPRELSEDDARSPPGPADYHALDAAWVDEPVRFGGAPAPAQEPIHFYDRRADDGARSTPAPNRSQENRHG